MSISDVDHAAAIAEYVDQNRHREDQMQVLWEASRRWPKATRDEVVRAVAIATELAQARIAEDEALIASARRLLRGDGG